MRLRLNPTWALLAATFVILAGTGTSVIQARVYHSTDEALSRAFPNARLERKALYLSRDQKRRITAIPGLEQTGRFHTFYVARHRQSGATIGYALFDTHVVRTKEETVLIALNADGSVREIQMISFFEPQEYLAPDRWLAVFEGKTSDDSLRAGRDLPTISGATLTTRAVSTAVRRTLELYRAHFADQAN